MVIIFDSGYEKIRLAKRFYVEMSSREYDSDNYWSDVMVNSEKNLRVMSEFSKSCPCIEVRYHGSGMRGIGRMGLMYVIKHRQSHHFKGVHFERIYSTYEAVLVKYNKGMKEE